jgi:hypothetical protein
MYQTLREDFKFSILVLSGYNKWIRILDNFFINSGTMKKKWVSAVLLFTSLWPAIYAQDPGKEDRMKNFIDDLMGKMTLQEKIGQLNLVTPGGFTATGPVVTKDVEEKIAKGQVGGLFSIFDPASVRRAQDLAVKNSRLHIPLIFGLDVIHGHRTTFPIPLALSYLGYGSDRKMRAYRRHRSFRRRLELDLFTDGRHRTRSAVGKDSGRCRGRSLPGFHGGAGNGERIPGRRPRQ